jgi:DNA-binding FadR family transcriptional regulator
MESENKIYRELKKRLTTDTYDHGQKLRAEVLREEFACSASTVREILFRLASEGLVHPRPKGLPRAGIIAHQAHRVDPYADFTRMRRRGLIHSPRRRRLGGQPDRGTS